jgi:hypothetical protein
MEQPIKYSDLIQPDDSITTLIKQLDEANEAYNNIGNSIKQEAQRISAAMVTISGATQQGRNATKGYSEDAQKLLKAERDLNFARSETARKIAELNAMKKDEQTITKLTVQLNRASEGSYEALSAQYALNKVRLNAMTEDMRKNTEQGRKLEAETRDIYDRMNELQKATGKYTLEVGNYEKAIGQLMGSQSRWMQNLQTLADLFSGGFVNGIKAAGQAIGGLSKQLLKLLMNPIVAVIAAIAAAFMALSKAITSSEQNTRALERIMAPFKGVMEVLLGVIQDVATWLLKGVEAMVDFASAAVRLAEKLPIVGKYMKDVNDKVAENIRLTKEKQRLEDQERAWSEQNAKLMANAAKFRADAEKSSDPKRRAQLFKMAQAAETTAFNNEFQHQKEVLKQMEEKAALNQTDTKTMEELSKQRVKVYNLEEQYYQRQSALNKKLRKEQNKMDNTGTTDKGGNTRDIAAERLAIEQKTQQTRISMIEDAFSRETSAINYNYDIQIQALRDKAEKDVALREALNEQIAALELKREMELADIVTKYAEKTKAEQEKIAQEKKKAADEAYRTQVDAINKEAELQQLLISNMSVNDKKKEELSLQAERERLQKIYDMNVQAGKDLTSLEMKTLQEQIKAADAQIEKAKKPQDLYDVLGLSLDDDKKAVITDSFNFALDQLNAYMDAWVQAAEKKVALAERDVENAQNVLNAEREARANGYASNVEYAQKELDMAKQNQQKALREQERAQKAQQALASVQQMTNMITATALIWSQLGFPWAIPAIAVMWGSFAAAKIKAAQMTQTGSEEYGEGTVELLQGGSHQSGNDVDLGRKKDGTRRRAEGGEFFAVINKRNSRKYRSVIPDVIRALNNGTFEQKYSGAYQGGADIQLSAGPQTDLGNLKSDVSAIRQQGERNTYTDSRGTHVVYKNLHRVILN